MSKADFSQHLDEHACTGNPDTTYPTEFYHEYYELVRMLWDGAYELGMKDGEIRVSELIGELAWGVDLPPLKRIEVYNPATSGTDSRAVYPTDLKPIFDIIYKKLKKVDTYNGFESLREGFYLLMNENSKLRKQLYLETEGADSQLELFEEQE